MIIIHENGRVELNAVHENYKSIGKAVNPPGHDEAFTAVPLPEGVACGYTMWANDNGLALELPENAGAEFIARYAPLVGPVCITTFEESGDVELVGMVDKAIKTQFETRLNAFLKFAEKIAEKRAVASN